MGKSDTTLKILRLKDNRKKEVELAVKKAVDSNDAEISKFLALEKEYIDTLRLFNKRHAEGFLDTNDINSFHNYFLSINNKISAQKKIYLQKQGELAFLRNTLVDAHKDKKMFEILNEKSVRKEVRDRIISEQKEADFLSVSKRLR